VRGGPRLRGRALLLTSLFMALTAAWAPRLRAEEPAGREAAAATEGEPEEEGRTDYAYAGPYLGLNGAFGYPLFEERISGATGGAAFDPSWGLDARLGLRVLKFLAVEAQYEWMAGFDVSGLPVADDVRIEGHTLTGNLRLYVPIWQVHPYVLTGIGVTRYRIDLGSLGSAHEDRFAGRLGGGLDMYVTEHVAVNFEAAALLTVNDLDFDQGSITSLHYLSASVGLMYRF